MSSEPNPWHFIDKYPGECTTEVFRKGNAEPCDEPAYAVAFDAEGYWPVCVRHTKGQALVPLSEIVGRAVGNEHRTNPNQPGGLT